MLLGSRQILNSYWQLLLRERLFLLQNQVFTSGGLSLGLVILVLVLFTSLRLTLAMSNATH